MDLFELYTKKLNPCIDRLWQRPRSVNVFYNDEVWYEARPLGHGMIEKFMKGLIKDAELTNPKYTNHSMRKTCIETLDENGIEARHIMYLSSHKSESSTHQYAKDWPENKKRQMHGILSFLKT